MTTSKRSVVKFDGFVSIVEFDMDVLNLHYRWALTSLLQRKVSIYRQMEGTIMLYRTYVPYGLSPFRHSRS